MYLSLIHILIGVNWLGDRSDTTNLSFRQEIRVMAVSYTHLAWQEANAGN